jgi:hypothetical protein
MLSPSSTLRGRYSRVAALDSTAPPPLFLTATRLTQTLTNASSNTTSVASGNTTLVDLGAILLVTFMNPESVIWIVT